MTSRSEPIPSRKSCWPFQQVLSRRDIILGLAYYGSDAAKIMGMRGHLPDGVRRKSQIGKPTALPRTGSGVVSVNYREQHDVIAVRAHPRGVCLSLCFRTRRTAKTLRAGRGAGEENFPSCT